MAVYASTIRIVLFSMLLVLPVAVANATAPTSAEPSTADKVLGDWYATFTQAKAVMSEFDAKIEATGKGQSPKSEITTFRLVVERPNKLLVASTRAFNLLRYLGAAYLIVLGLRTLSKRGPEVGTVEVSRASLRRIFVQGVVVNLLNPHTALFFFAFLPQFVNPSRGAVPLQIVTLGLIFILMSATTDAVWAIGAGTAGNWIRGNRRFARAQRFVTGCALIGLGAAAAVSGRRSK